MTRLLTIEEAAEAMSVHPNTIRSLLPRLGAIDLNQGRKGNRLIRIPEKGIEAYLRDSIILQPLPIRQKKPSYKLERRRA